MKVIFYDMDICPGGLRLKCTLYTVQLLDTLQIVMICRYTYPKLFSNQNREVKDFVSLYQLSHSLPSLWATGKEDTEKKSVAEKFSYC